MPSFLIVPLLALASGQPTQYEPTYFSEAAVIQDADGYTNVRADKNVRSAVRRKIRTNEAFLFDTEAYMQHEEWIEVSGPTGRFSDDSGFIGYMHRSRIRPVGSLPACQAPELVFEQKLVRFQPKAHRITYAPEGNWVQAIDGRGFWGTDGGVPRTETTRIRVTIAGQPVTIPAKFYRTLYEASPEFHTYKNGSTYFVVQFNSDGAGSYVVIWVLRRSGLVQQIVEANC